LIAFLVSLLDTHGGEAPRVKRVLILHSFGRDFAPFNAVSSAFRTELARQSTAPVEFLEASLETARFTESGSEIPFVEYLRALFAERSPALLVPFGAPAMNFLLRHRERLFPGVPILVSAPRNQKPLSGGWDVFRKMDAAAGAVRQKSVLADNSTCAQDNGSTGRLQGCGRE